MTTETETQNLIQSQTAIEKEIASSVTEVTIRKRQLRELTPQRKALEQESLDKLECSIDALPQWLEELEKQMAAGFKKLQIKLKEIKGEDVS